MRLTDEEEGYFNPGMTDKCLFHKVAGTYIYFILTIVQNILYAIKIHKALILGPNIFVCERPFVQGCSNLTLQMKFFTCAWDMISMREATKKERNKIFEGG